MKKITRHLGVTLLEVLLVLAVAAMIIIMSVRYYQSTNVSQQANTTLGQIQAITAAANNLGQATGSYSQVSNNKIAPLMPTNGLTSAWFTPITITPGTETTTYTVSFVDMPPGVCAIVVSYITTDPHIFQAGESTGTGGTKPVCSSTTENAPFSYMYKSNP